MESLALERRKSREQVSLNESLIEILRWYRRGPIIQSRKRVDK